ncbi:hypothetical protein [Pelagibacterium limicola]|uniref:hypothetical protein n=1 Tax=Pelagibacterium limicola TaxID=2791022 RepID=UPI0018AFDDE4|nr:hypothetical protein [Pelagibacterium limicola]
MTLTRRVALLERDRAEQSRIITELVANVAHGFSPEQLAQIRAAMRDELADAGLRLDGAEHQDEAREDFRFIRRFRRGIEGTSAKIGWLVIAALLGGVAYLVNLGLNTWRGGG